MLKDYDVVVATRDLSNSVKIGARGAVLLCYESDEYEVEFFGKSGESLDVLTVSGACLRLETEPEK